MQGAILALSEKPPSRFRQLLSLLRRPRANQIGLPYGEGAVLVFTLPYTAEAFAALTGRQKARLVNRYAGQMRKSGVTCVYPVRALRGTFAAQENFTVPDGRRIFSALAAHIIEKHIQTFSLSPARLSVCIYEKNFSAAGERAAESMAMQTKRMCFVTQNIDSARAAAGRLFEAYGLAAQAETSEKLLNTCDIVLLLDAPTCEIVSSALVVDFSGRYPYRCRNDLYFKPAFGYAPVLPYFERPDCRSAEFIGLCCGVAAYGDTEAALAAIGWRCTAG